MPFTKIAFFSCVLLSTFLVIFFGVRCHRSLHTVAVPGDNRRRSMQADSNYHSKALKLLMPQQEKHSELLFFFALTGSKLWTEEGNCGGKDQGCHQWLWTNWKEFHPLLAWEEGLSFGSCCHQ
jgi:hypothetical protein